MFGSSISEGIREERQEVMLNLYNILIRLQLEHLMQFLAFNAGRILERSKEVYVALSS